MSPKFDLVHTPFSPASAQRGFFLPLPDPLHSVFLAAPISRMPSSRSLALNSDSSS